MAAPRPCPPPSREAPPLSCDCSFPGHGVSLSSLSSASFLTTKGVHVTSLKLRGLRGGNQSARPPEPAAGSRPAPALGGPAQSPHADTPRSGEARPGLPPHRKTPGRSRGRRGEGRCRQRGGGASAEPTAERPLLPAGRALVGGKRGRAQSPDRPRGCAQVDGPQKQSSPKWTFSGRLPPAGGRGGRAQPCLWQRLGGQGRGRPTDGPVTARTPSPAASRPPAHPPPAPQGR